MGLFTVWEKENKIEVVFEEGQTILNACHRAHLMMASPCGGQGRCGKCKVLLMESEGEREKSAMVLACQTPAKDGMVVQLDVTQRNEDAEVLSEIRVTEPEVEWEKQESHSGLHQKYGIAIDLGTTSIVVQLLRGPHCEVVQSIQGLNPQREYGADVLSRMVAANAGKQRELQQLVTMYLEDAIGQLLQNASIPISQVNQIVIAGNTTMMHLLRGYLVEGLGKFPFEPVSISKENLTVHEIFPELTVQGVAPRVILLPGISAFVGADITSGLYALNIDQAEKVQMLVDLGTNGEMAIGNAGGILATSTAAGPAFEGGNLSCGVGSVKGAISQVEIRRKKARCKTIGNRPAIGICGTGAIELLAELVENGLVDVNGLLLPEYRQKGFPVAESVKGTLYFTQEDIRQLQLAKAAIRAGIELLIQWYGVDYEQLEHVYLAGGMGFSLNIEKAVRIGLLPEEIEDKVVIAGNTCLAGTIFSQKDSKQEERINKIIKSTKVRNLADYKEFQPLFLHHINM